MNTDAKSLWKKYLFLALDMLFLLLGVLGMYLQTEKPDLPIKKLGFDSDFLIIQDSLNSYINKNDILLSINNINVKTRDQVAFICDGFKIGDTVNIRVKGKEEINNFQVKLIKYYTWIYDTVTIFVFLLFFLAGIYVYIKKPDDRVAKIFHYLAMSAAMIIILSWGKTGHFGFYLDFLLRALSDASHIIMSILFLHFTLIYPVKRYINYSKILTLSYSIGLALLIYLEYLNYFALSNKSLELYMLYENIKTYGLYTFLILNVLAGLYIFIKNYLESENEADRKKQMWIIFGVLIAFFSYIFLWIIPNELLGWEIISETLMILLVGVAPIAFFISLVRYRVMDIDFILNRSSVYTSAVALLLIFYFGLTVLITYAFNLSELISLFDGIIKINKAQLIATIIIALIFEPVRSKIQKIIDKKFFRTTLNFRLAQENFLLKIKECTDIYDIAGLTVDTINDNIPVNHIAYIEYDCGTEEFSLLKDKNYFLSDEMLIHLKQIMLNIDPDLPMAKPEVMEEGINFIPAENSLNGKLGAKLILFSGIGTGKFINIILMGEKNTRFKYTFEDIDLLRFIKNQSAIAIDKINLNKELHLKQEEVEKLAELNQMKSFFVSSVSHDLKTPLTSIKLFAEILQNHKTMEEENKNVYLDIIQTECDRLNRLINNVLDFSKIEKGIKKYHFADINLNSTVEHVVNIFKNQLILQKFDVNLNISKEKLNIIADQDAIIEAVINILSNAAKYSGDRKVIDVEVFQTTGHCCISIVDQGLGISDEDQEHIFDAFYRSKNEKASNVGGTGIGLAIVNNIMQAHGGHIDVRSKLGEGSNFTLYFPKGTLDEKTFNN